MATAIGYVRVSTVGQVDGEGLGVQRERIAAWCAYQGSQLETTHEDAGVSGGSMDRPGLKKALARVLQLGSDGILATTLK